MRREEKHLLTLLQLFLLLSDWAESVRTYRLETQLGSTLLLPPCLSSTPPTNNETTTILFKSDSGELIMMNGKLISENPRYLLKNEHSTELIIKSIQSSDQGQYECQTDQLINSVVHLILVHVSTIHLTVPENSNLTLQCMEQGMWTIEESHRGGPVRTQYTRELVFNHVQRDDQRFRTIICSSQMGKEKREYIIDVTYKPTVKLILSTRRRLICLVCAHPLPHRIQWWWNTRKERDDLIHQTNINQSCIAQQITFNLEDDERSSSEQMVTCEAENPYGTDRDSLLFKAASAIRARPAAIHITSTTPPIPTASAVTNQSSSDRCISLLLIIVSVRFVLHQHSDFVK